MAVSDAAGKAIISVCAAGVPLARVRMLSAALERGGWAVTVASDRMLPARLPTRVGGLSLETLSAARLRPWQRAARFATARSASRGSPPSVRRQAERWFLDIVERSKPDLILAMDPSALCLARSGAESARGQGRTVRLAYDRTAHPAPGSPAAQEEAAAISDVHIAFAASASLARHERWPPRLRSRVQTVYSIPLELASARTLVAEHAAAIKRQPPPRVGLFLARDRPWPRSRELRRFLALLPDASTIVYSPPEHVRSLKLGLLGHRRAAVQPMPDDDDVADVVRLLDAIVCPSAWDPDLPPATSTLAGAALGKPFVAARGLVDELAAGHAVGDTSIAAVAHATRAVLTPSSPSSAREGAHAPPVARRLAYAQQVEAIGEAIGAKPHPKLGIGPRNGNGQAWAWAQALRRRRPGLAVEAFTAQYAGGRIAMSHQTDISIPMSDWQNREWLRWWAHRVRSQYSHLLIEQGLAAAGPLKGSSFVNELPLLLESGVRAALVFRGSEIRNPAGHAERERWSPFRDPGDPLVQKLQKVSDVSRRALEAIDAPAFVTTLDLLDDVPQAVWLPQVLDLPAWASAEPTFQRQRPVVMHAPSSTMLKGSRWVDEACQPLHEKGVIEYHHLRDVPYAEMPNRIRRADIVIDQLALGSYGVLALQAMACERLVIGHVNERVRNRLEDDLPVLQAEPPDLRRILEEALAARDWARAFARSGPDYVGRHHSGEQSAEQLLRHLVNA